MTIRDLTTDVTEDVTGDVTGHVTGDVIGDATVKKHEFLTRFSELNAHIEAALASQDFDRAMRIDSARRDILREFTATADPDGDKMFFAALEQCAADNARTITRMTTEMSAVQRRTGQQVRGLSRYGTQQR